MRWEGAGWAEIGAMSKDESGWAGWDGMEWDRTEWDGAV